jgi:hypothetical protein
MQTVLLYQNSRLFFCSNFTYKLILKIFYIFPYECRYLFFFFFSELRELGFALNRDNGFGAFGLRFGLMDNGNVLVAAFFVGSIDSLSSSLSSLYTLP